MSVVHVGVSGLEEKVEKVIISKFLEQLALQHLTTFSEVGVGRNGADMGMPRCWLLKSVSMQEYSALKTP